MSDYKLPKPMKWAVLVGRRRTTTAAIIESLAVSSYDALVAWCAANRVEPPPFDDVKDLVARTSKSKKTKATSRPKSTTSSQEEPEAQASSASSSKRKVVEKRAAQTDDS